jgi:hypothetical protein
VAHTLFAVFGVLRDHAQEGTRQAELTRTHCGNTGAKDEISPLEAAQGTRKAMFGRHLGNQVLEARTRRGRASVIGLAEPWGGQELGD